MQCIPYVTLGPVAALLPAQGCQSPDEITKDLSLWTNTARNVLGDTYLPQEKQGNWIWPLCARKNIPHLPGFILSQCITKTDWLACGKRAESSHLSLLGVLESPHLVPYLTPAWQVSESDGEGSDRLHHPHLAPVLNSSPLPAPSLSSAPLQTVNLAVVFAS